MAFTILSEFLENSTIHGLGHISSAKSGLERVLWASIVVAFFVAAICMISSSYKEWQESPVSTTISTHPITDLQFPQVTVCPPWGSNTALNYLLEKVKNVNFTEKKRKELLQIAKKVFIDLPSRKHAQQIMKTIGIENQRNMANNLYDLPEVVIQEEFYIQHYTLNLPNNSLAEEGDIVISVQSNEEWSYMLQNKTLELYKSSDGGNPLSEAEEFCTSLDAQLASVGSEAEQDEIKKVADKKLVWLGGIRNQSWQWLDGTRWTYQNWGQGAP